MAEAIRQAWRQCRSVAKGDFEKGRAARDRPSDFEVVLDDFAITISDLNEAARTVIRQHSPPAHSR